MNNPLVDGQFGNPGASNARRQMFSDACAGRRDRWQKPVFVQIAWELLGPNLYAQKPGDLHFRENDQYEVLAHSTINAFLGVIRYDEVTGAVTAGAYLAPCSSITAEECQGALSEMVNRRFIGNTRFLFHKTAAVLRPMSPYFARPSLQQAMYALGQGSGSTFDLVREPSR